MPTRIFALLICAMSASCIFAQTTFPHPGITDKKDIYTLFKSAIIHQSPFKTDTVDLLIYKNKIVQVGDADELEIPKNTLVKELSGYAIYPSFIELNSDYGVSLPEKIRDKRGPEYERSENKARAWNDAIHPERKAVNHFEPDAKKADTLRSMGFGVVLSQMRDGIIRGTSLVTATGEGTANDNVLLTDAAMHYSFDKGQSIQDYPSSLMGAIGLLRQTFYDLEWYQQAADRESNFSLEALGDADDKPAFFEAKEKYDLRRLAKIAAEFEREFIVYGAGDSYQLQQIDFPGLGALVVPLNFPEPYDMSDPDLSRFVDQQSLLEWEWAPFNPFYIQQTDIPFALSGNGVKKPETFFANLRKCVTDGLQKDSALAALTTFPAALLGLENQIGRIEPGYRANFFVATGDVFTDPDAHITEHWINGQRYAVKDTAEIKLEATYTLNVSDTYYTLRVKGDAGYEAEVMQIEGSDTTKYKSSLTRQSREVVLQFRSDSTGGYYRLSGTIISDNRIWDGTGIDPHGNEVMWNAIRRKAKKPMTKSDSTQQALDSIPILPPRYFPFKAYGFDTLPQPETILFTHATIWTNDSIGILENGKMLIRDGKIVAVDRTLNTDDYIPKKQRENIRVIDLQGRHLTPGIIDEHSHIAISRGVNEGTEANSSEVRISDALNPDDINIYRQLAGGVTTSQLLHGSANPIGGQSAIIKLRWGRGFDEMIFKEAPPFIKFALGENVKQSNWGAAYNVRYPQTRMGVEQFYYDNFYRAREYGQLKTLAAAREAAQKKKRRRKKPEETEPFHTDLQMEALVEILTGHRHITCHSYVQSEINMLLHVADSMGFEVNTFTHGLEAYKVADKLKAHGTAVGTFSDWWAYKYEVKDAIPYNAAILITEGVVVAINSDDAEMGRRLNQEAAKTMKYGGVSAEDALKMVTLNPAKMLHIDTYVGSITPGKDADFVIWSGDPLSVYSKAEQTWIDGAKYFDRTAADAKRERDQKERARISGLIQDAKNAGTKTKKPARQMERYYTCESED